MSGRLFRYVDLMGDEQKKGLPKPSSARFAIAENLNHLMKEYPHGFLKGITPEQLASGLDGALNAKTIRRIKNPYDKTSPKLDTIDLLASFFKVDSWELITPRSRQAAIAGKERQTPVTPANSSTAQLRRQRDKSLKR